MQINVLDYLLPDERIVVSLQRLPVLRLTEAFEAFQHPHCSGEADVLCLTVSFDQSHPQIPGGWWLSRGLVAWFQLLLQAQDGLRFVPDEVRGVPLEDRLCMPGCLEAGEIYALRRSAGTVARALCWDCPVGGLPQPFEDRLNLSIIADAPLANRLADVVVRNAMACGIAVGDLPNHAAP
jgi:hypothetical protein